MIDNAFAIWLRSTLPELSSRAWAWDPQMVKGDIQKPFATAALLNDPQSQAVLGDAVRQQHTKLQVAITAVDNKTAKALAAKLNSALQSAMAYGAGGTLVPGVDFMIELDVLSNPSCDRKTYTSGQPGWFASPVPVIYSGTTPISSTAYTIDYSTGIVTFSAVRGTTEEIAATYKAGVFDFTIAELTYGPIVDIRNTLLRYNAIFTIDAWYFFKTTAAKYV